MPRRNIVALILAGGRSSRMGALKPLLPVNGKPAIQWAVETFKEAGISDVRVVVGFRSEQLIQVLETLGVKIIVNPDPERGMFSSIQEGLRSFSDTADAFFLMPADMPMLRSQTIEKLLKVYDQSLYSVIYPTYLGERGHPPLITRRCFSEILTEKPDQNLRNILEAFESDSHEVRCPDSGIRMDMDTPADYQDITTYCANREAPTCGECAMLFDIYGTPEPVIRHGRAVAAVATEIAIQLNQWVLMGVDIPLIYAAGLIHDIGKGKPHHGRVGARILEKEGFPSLSDAIASHMDLRLPEGDFEIGPREILYLADKMVEEDTLVPLELRFSNAIRRNPSAGTVPAKVAVRLQTAQRIKQRIEQFLGIDDLYAALYPRAQ